MRTSGFIPDDNICWDFRNPRYGERRLRCKCPACTGSYGERALAHFGRCRSGKRWFWSAHTLFADINHEANGFTDTEEEAIEAAMAAVRNFPLGVPVMAFLDHGSASRRLQKLNAAKRAARPPSNAKDAPVVEYLYSYALDYDEYEHTERRCLYRFPITKRTAQRVYYWNKGEHIDEHGEPIVDKYNIQDFTPTEPAFLDRAKLEAEGEIWSRTARTRLYVSRERMVAFATRHDSKPIGKADLAALKEAMAAAHPDRGGNNAAFIEARAAYVAARRMQRGAA